MTSHATLSKQEIAKLKEINKNIMTYTFKENNFKNHLRNIANKSWFSQDSSNIRYENSNGTFDAITINSSLNDPSTISDKTAGKKQVKE